MDSTGSRVSGGVISTTGFDGQRESRVVESNSSRLPIQSPLLRPVSTTGVSSSLPPLLQQLCREDDQSDVSSFDLDEDEDEDHSDDSGSEGPVDPEPERDADAAVMADDSALEARSVSVSSSSAASIPSSPVLGRSVTAPYTTLPSLGRPPALSVDPSLCDGTLRRCPALPNASQFRSMLRRFGPVRRSPGSPVTSFLTPHATGLQPITCGDLATCLSRSSTSPGSGSASTASVESECISAHERLCAHLAQLHPSLKVEFREAT